MIFCVLKSALNTRLQKQGAGLEPHLNKQMLIFALLSAHFETVQSSTTTKGGGMK